MNKTKIEWCDYTWNPVTGCLHGCKYCYARRIAERFGLAFAPNLDELDGCKYDGPEGIDTMLELNKPYYKNGRMQPYPMAFQPTFHRYRLDEPKRKTKPAKIFVSSMGDLFGDWVPDEWISEVMKAIALAPWHRYLFLTKNPERYFDYFDGAWQEIPEEYDFSKANMMFGTSITNQKDADNLRELNLGYLDFLSIEPLLGDIDIEHILYEEHDYYTRRMKWVIIGAQTGPGAKPPKPEWVQNVIDQARAVNIPIFLKNNLKWPEQIMEFPKGLEA